MNLTNTNNMADILQDIVSSVTQKPLNPATNLPVTTSTDTSGGDKSSPLDIITSSQPFEFQTRPYSQRETLPDTYESYKKYIPNPMYGTDLDEIRSQNQGVGGKVSAMLWRAVPVTLAKVGQLATGVFGFGASLPFMAGEALMKGEVTPDSYGMIYDNALMDVFSGMEEAVKGWAPIYKQNQYKYGDIFEKMSTADYWTEDFADGVEFLASAYLGGFITKPLQVGGAVIEGAGAAQKGFAATKLGKKIIEAQTFMARSGKGSVPLLTRVLNNWDLKVITTYNTIGEASIEARGVYKDLMKQYEDGSWGNGVPLEEAKREAGERAAQTFAFNAAVLVLPNAIQADAFWGKSALSKAAIRNVIEGKYNVKQGLSAWGRNMLKGALSEGLWEEGIQSAIQNYESRVFNPVTNNQGILGDIGGVLNEYVKGFSRTDDQLAMVTGAIIGALGGTAETIGDARKERNQIQSINKVLEIADTVYNSNYQSLFKKFKVDKVSKNEKGEDVTVSEETIINPLTGKTEIDGEAVARLFNQNIMDATLINEIMTAQLNNDNVHEAAAKRLALSRLAMQYFDMPFGMEVLEAKLDMIAESKAKDPKFTESFVMEELAKNKEAVSKMKDSWDKIKQNTKISIEDDEDRMKFNDKREKAEFFHTLNKGILEDYLAQLESNFSLTLTDAEQAALEEKKETVRSLIKDSQATIDFLTKDQDKAYKEFKESSPEHKSKKYEEKLAELEKEDSAVVEKIKAETDPTKIPALEAERERIAKEFDVLSYELEASILSETSPTSTSFNITRSENARVTADRMRTGESSLTQLFSDLGHNFFINQEARQMIRDGANPVDVIAFLSRSEAIPSEMTLETIKMALDSTNLEMSFANLINNLSIENTFAIYGVGHTMESIYSKFGEDDVKKAIANYRESLDKRQNLTSREKLIILTAQRLSTADKVETIMDEDGYGEESDILEIERSAYTDLVHLLNTAFFVRENASSIVHGKEAAFRADILKEFLKKMETVRGTFINVPEVDFAGLSTLKDLVSRYLESRDLISSDKLTKSLLYGNLKWNAIDDILNYPDMKREILERYLINQKIAAAEAEYAQASLDTYEDIETVSAHLSVLQAIKSSIDRRKTTSVPVSPGIYDDNLMSILDSVIKNLEELQEAANKNRNDKVGKQISTMTRHIQNLLMASGQIYSGKEDGLVVLNKALLDGITSLLPDDQKHVLDLLNNKESGKDFIERFSEIIVQHIVSSPTKAKALQALFDHVSESNYSAGLLTVLSKVTIEERRRSLPHTISSGEAWKLNPITNFTNIMMDLEALKGMGKDERRKLRSALDKVDGPINNFSKHRDFRIFLEELNTMIKSLSYNPELEKKLLEDITVLANISEYQLAISKASSMLKVNVLERYNREKALIEEAIKNKQYLPTLQQLIVIRQLTGRVLSGPRSNGGFAHFMLVNGTLGTGKTEIIPKWLMNMLGLNSNQVMATGHNPNTARQIASKLGTKEISITDIIDNDIDDIVKIIVVDEIHTLTFDQLNDLQKKVARINSKRKSGNELLVLGLGDPYQNTATSSGVSSLYDPHAMNPFHQTNIAEAFETTPLTVRYRSSINSINSFVDKFYGRTGEVKGLIAIHNESRTQGVVGLSNIDSVINSIKSLPPDKSKAIVVSNLTDLESYKKALTAAGIDYYDFRDTSKSTYGPTKVQLYVYTDVGGITVDNAYVHINRGDFTGDELGQYKYNTAMYTALGRAKTLLSVVDPSILNKTSTNVEAVSIEDELDVLKGLLLQTMERDREGLEKIYKKPIDGVKDVEEKPEEEEEEEEDKKEEEKPTAEEPAAEEPPAEEPPKPEPPVEDTKEDTPEEEEGLSEEIEEDTDTDGYSEGMKLLKELPDVGTNQLEEGEFLLEFPNKEGLKNSQTTSVIVAPLNGNLHVLTKLKDVDFYVSIGVLSQGEVSHLVSKGYLKGEDLEDALKANALTAVPAGTSYRLINPGLILASGELTAAEIIRFDYNNAIDTGDGEQTIKSLTEKLKVLTDSAPGSIIDIEYKIFRSSGKTDNVDTVNQELENRGTSFRVRPGFPYAIVTQKSSEGSITKFYVRLKVRKLNDVQDREQLMLTKEVTDAIGVLQKKFSEGKHPLKIQLGDLLFNTIINRLHKLAKINANGEVTFGTVDKEFIEKEILDYLYGDNFKVGKRRINGEGYFKMLGINLPNRTELERRLLSMKSSLNKEGVFVVSNYYGVTSSSYFITVDPRLEGNELNAELEKKLKEKRDEYRIQNPQVNTDGWKFTLVDGSSNKYILTTATGDTENRIKFYSYTAGKGAFQKFLNKLAQANANLATKDGLQRFITERKIKGKNIRVAKGFLSMEGSSGLNRLAGNMRLFLLKVGDMDASRLIELDNLSVYYKMITEMHEDFFVDGNGKYYYNAFRTSDDMTTRRADAGYPPLEIVSDEKYRMKKEVLGELFNEIQREMQLLETGNLESTQPLALSTLQAILKKDSSGQHPHLRSQLPINEFNVSVRKSDAVAYMKDRITSSLVDISSTKAKVKFIPVQETPKQDGGEDLLTKLKRRKKSRNLIKEGTVENLGEKLSTEEAFILFKRLIPTITRSDMQAMAKILNEEGKEAWGRMVDGVVQLEQQKDGTVYRNVLLHEVFHLVWNYYLTENERKDIRKFFTKKYGAMSEGQIEERLALEFQVWKKSEAPRKSLLSRILDKILSFFGIVSRYHSSIEDLFHSIHEGKYKNKVETPVGIARDMVKISRDFHGNTNHWRIAYKAITSALEHFTNPIRPNSVPLPHTQAVYKAWEAITGKDPVSRILNLVEINQMVKALSFLSENEGVITQTALRDMIKDVVINRGISSPIQLLADLGMKSIREQENFLEALKNANLFEIDSDDKITIDYSNLHDTLSTMFDLQAAYKSITNPATYLRMIEDIDSTVKLSFAKGQMSRDLKAIQDEFDSEEEPVTKSEEESKRDDNAWKEMLLQIVEADEQNAERNLTMETKLFLSNIFELELDENGEPRRDKDGDLVYKLDNLGFRIPVSSRYAYYSLLTIMQHLDLNSLPKRGDVLVWFQNALKNARRQAHASKKAASVVYAVEQLAHLALSARMDSGFPFNGIFRFFMVSNPNDVDTFVYTKNLLKKIDLDGREYTAHELLYKDLMKHESTITLIDIERINEKYKEDPPFVIVRKNRALLNENFIETILNDHIMNLRVEHRFVEGEEENRTKVQYPVISFEEGPGGVLIPTMLAGVDKKGNGKYNRIYNAKGDELYEIYSHWTDNLEPELLKSFRNNIIKEEIAAGKSREEAIKIANEKVETEYPTIEEAELKKYLISTVITHFYRKTAAADLLATLITNFSNQRRQNLHVVERTTEYGLLRVSLVKDQTLNIRHTYKASAENAIIKTYNVRGSVHDLKAKAISIANEIKGINSYTDATMNTWKDSVESLRKKVVENGRAVSNPVLNEKEKVLLEIVKSMARGLDFKSKSLDSVFRFVLGIPLAKFKLARMLTVIGVISDKTSISPSLELINTDQLIADILEFSKRAVDLFETKERSETQEDDNSGETAITAFDEEEMFDVSIVLRDSQRMLNSISTALVANSESVVNPSVLGADKKKRFLFTQSSHGTRVLEALGNPNNKSHFHLNGLELQKKDWEASRLEKALELEYSEFFSHNSILKSRDRDDTRYELVDHDAQKTNDNYVVGYPDESPSEWMERNIIGGFLAPIDLKDSRPHYVQYVWTISNKRRMIGTKVPILSEVEVKDSLYDMLTQITTRSNLLRDFVQYFDVTRYINFDILTELMEEGDEDAINFNKYVEGDRHVDIEGIKDRLVGKLYKKTLDISEEVKKQMIEDIIAFPEDAGIKFKHLISTGVIDGEKVVELSNGKTIKLKDIPTLSSVKTRQRSGDKHIFNKNEYVNVIVQELINVAVSNYYVNSYFLNQIATGDYAFYRNAVEVIKRMSGVYALGNAPGMALFSGVTFDVLIGKDLKVKTGYEMNEKGEFVAIQGSIFHGTKVYGMTGNYTDAAGYMLPERRQALSASMGSAYRLGNVTKPAHFEIAQVEIETAFDIDGNPTAKKVEHVPVMLKEAVVSLEDSICLIDKNGPNVKENWTPLGFLRHNMRMLNAQEYAFLTGVKVGAPSKNWLADSERILVDENYWKVLLPNKGLHTRTLKNANYRMQFNPASTKDAAKVRNPGQLIFFTNILEGNVENAETIYAMMTNLIEDGISKLRDLDTKAEGETRSKLEERVIQSIESPDAQRLRELLDAGVSPDNPATVTKWINHLSSYISGKTVEIKFSGNKLVMQSAYGMQAYGLNDEVREKGMELQYREYSYVDSSGVRHNRMFVEALVPSYFKDKVALGDFLYSDMLAFRIPSSGMHSSVPIKVAGFYDTENTNIIIIPKDVVVLHGSDYDVDSLFVIRRELMEIEGFKGFGLNQADDEQTLNSIRERKRKVISTMKRLNFLAGISQSEDTDTNAISLLAEHFDNLIVEVEKRAVQYKAAYNDINKFNPVEIEKAFNEWLNRSSKDFKKWSETKTGDIDAVRPGEKTILQWAMEDYGDKFNLHYLRYSFSLYYNIQSVRWINQDVNPGTPWQNITDKETVSTEDIVKTVGDKSIVKIKKGEIENRGRWVPYIQKTPELTRAANALDKELGLSLSLGHNMSEANIRNYLIARDAAANAEDREIDLEGVIKRRIVDIKKSLKELNTEVDAAKSLVTDNYDPKGPIGYTKEKVMIDGVEKEVWVFDRDFENKFRQASSGSNEKFVQSVLNKYYKNAIIESLLELITAQRNRKTMLSAIMLEAFNAEGENFQDENLYAEGTVFRYLQDVVLKSKQEELNSLQDYERKIRERKLKQLKVKSDMSNILHSQQSFMSNFEGAELTGVFANEMKAVAYIIKSGYTFYTEGAIKEASLNVAISKVEKVDGSDKKIVEDIQKLAQSVAEKKQEINTFGVPTKENIKGFLSLVKDLKALENDYSKKVRIVQKGDPEDFTTIKIPVFIGSGEKTSTTPIATITADEALIIDGKSFYQFIDSVENWEMFDALLNAAIDNVKEQILPIINGNKFTANALGAMLMLDVDMKKIALFMNQPAIRELSNFRYGVNSLRLNTKLNEIIELLKAKGVDISSLSRELTTEQLEKGFVDYIDGIEIKSMDVEKLIIQYKVLNQYKTLSTIGDDLFTLSRALSILKDLPVFVDEIMNVKEDWDKIVTFDADYNAKPNPNFSLYLGDWLTRVPHILSAIKAMDFLAQKVKDTYVHSEEFAGVIDKISGLPDIFPNENSNRNKVARRFESLKLIAGTVYDSSTEPDFAYTRTTRAGKALKKTLTGNRAFSQRFLTKLDALKRYSNDNVLPTKIKLLLDSMQVYKNRFGEWNIKFVMGPSAEYADLIDMETGFRELNNFLHNGVPSEFSITDEGEVTIIAKSSGLFNGFQQDFLKYAAINYGVAFGVINYTTILPKELVMQFDEQLKSVVDRLKSIRTINLGSVKSVGTHLESVRDKLAIHIVANNFANLKYIPTTYKGKALNIQFETEIYESSFESREVRITGGVDTFSDGTEIFYDLKVNNIIPSLQSESEDTEVSIGSVYPKYIKYGKFNTAYIRVFSNDRFVYYKQIGANYDTVYDLKNLNIYSEETYFDKSEYTHHASEIIINGSTLTANTHGYLVPKWIKDTFERKKKQNKPFYIYVVDKTDIDKTGRIKIKVTEVDLSKKSIQGIIMPKVTEQEASSLLLSRSPLEYIKKGFKIVIPTTDTLSTEHGVAQSLLTPHKQIVKKVVHISHTFQSDESNVAALSPYSFNQFTYEERLYYSANHAYQTWKTGVFDEDAYMEIGAKYTKTVKGKVVFKTEEDLKKVGVEELSRTTTISKKKLSPQHENLMYNFMKLMLTENVKKNDLIRNALLSATDFTVNEADIKESTAKINTAVLRAVKEVQDSVKPGISLPSVETLGRPLKLRSSSAEPYEEARVLDELSLLEKEIESNPNQTFVIPLDLTASATTNRLFYKTILGIVEKYRNVKILNNIKDVKTFKDVFNRLSELSKPIDVNTDDQLSCKIS